MQALDCRERQLISQGESPTLLVNGHYASLCSIRPLVHSPVAQAFSHTVGCRQALPGKSCRSCGCVEGLRVHGGGCGGMPQLEQAALFHQAREIIGLAGAALTNVLYCRVIRE